MILSTLAITRPAWAAIPSDIKYSTDTQKTRAAIDTSIKAEIEDLTGEDMAKRNHARDTLAGEVNAPESKPFSPQFVDAYAQALDQALLPLTDSQDVRVRLNVAIIVARVGEKVDSARLENITEKLLQDKSPAVLIWALKAARVELPAVLQVAPPANQQKFIAAIKSHADDPQLLPLVYDALSLRYQDGKLNMPNRDKMVATVVPEMLSLLQDRVKMYEKTVPPDPTAVVPAVLFLSNPTNWKALNGNPTLQVQIVQTLSDLIGVAAQRGLANNAAAIELGFVINKSASGLAAIALTVAQSDPAAQQVFNALQPLIHSVPGSPQQAQLSAGVPAILKSYTKWAAINPQPSIESNSPTTGPATATVPAK